MSPERGQAYSEQEPAARRTAPAESEVSMTKLERRCRLLMRAYPAQYRRERGEEMLGTLLDTTPPGRTWPLPRDVGALLAGGLSARGAAQRRLSLRANLRISVYAGVAIYLGFVATGGIVSMTGPSWSGWPYLATIALIALTVVLAAADSRRTVVLAGALPAAAVAIYAAAGPRHDLDFQSAATFVTCLAILVAVAGRDARPARWWFWPVGLVAFAPLLFLLGYGLGSALNDWLLVVIGTISLAWILVDARPAIAACMLVLVVWLPVAAQNLDFGASAGVLWPSAIPIAVAALAAWRLSRQSAGVRRRRV